LGKARGEGGRRGTSKLCSTLVRKAWTFSKGVNVSSVEGTPGMGFPWEPMGPVNVGLGVIAIAACP